MTPAGSRAGPSADSPAGSPFAYPVVIDVNKLQEALQLVEDGQLDDAATKLAPLVKRKRSTRAGRMNAEAMEVDELKGWLKGAIAEPDSPDSLFMVERAYYKLRTQRPA